MNRKLNTKVKKFFVILYRNNRDFFDMKIAIIAAMSKELDLILSQLDNYTQSILGDTTVYYGNEGEHSLLISQCGIGKVNSALRTLAIINQFKPELVINTGVAGGVDASMAIGSVLVAEKVAYHDVWCGPGTEYGRADGCPLFFTPLSEGLNIMKSIANDSDLDIRFGLLCSGDKFISTPEEVAEIKSHFPAALGCDMESASIAQTCYLNNIPFMIIRVMSDMPGGGENIAEYNNFWNDAPARTFLSLSYLLSKL